MARAASTRTATTEATPAPRGRGRGKGDEGGRSEGQLKSHLRTKAERIVLDNHRTEFNQELDRLYEQEGLNRKRILSQEEKDARALQEILERNPDLKAKLAQELLPAESEEGSPGLDYNEDDIGPGEDDEADGDR